MAAALHAFSTYPSCFFTQGSRQLDQPKWEEFQVSLFLTVAFIRHIWFGVCEPWLVLSPTLFDTNLLRYYHTVSLKSPIGITYREQF